LSAAAYFAVFVISSMATSPRGTARSVATRMPSAAASSTVPPEIETLRSSHTSFNPNRLKRPQNPVQLTGNFGLEKPAPWVTPAGSDPSRVLPDIRLELYDEVVGRAGACRGTRHLQPEPAVVACQPGGRFAALGRAFHGGHAQPNQV